MRFRFCWDVDCPDWLLAEIAALSKMTSVKLRLLVGQVAKAIPGPPLSYEVVEKLTKDAKLESSEAMAAVAAVRWVLERAGGAGVGGPVLDSELQQLGLPKEHAAALTRVYSEHQPRLRQALRQGSLKVGGDPEWACDVVGVNVGGRTEAVAQLTLDRHGEESKVALTPDQLLVLIHELSEARQIMEAIN